MGFTNCTPEHNEPWLGLWQATATINRVPECLSSVRYSCRNEMIPVQDTPPKLNSLYFMCIHYDINITPSSARNNIIEQISNLQIPTCYTLFRLKAYTSWLTDSSVINHGWLVEEKLKLKSGLATTILVLIIWIWCHVCSDSQSLLYNQFGPILFQIRHIVGIIFGWQEQLNKKK